MEWPSQNVAQGGILQPAKATYSPETHKFIKLLMEESKLTMMQRKKVDYFLRNGEPLPSLANTGRRRNPHIPEVTIRPGSSKRRTRDDIVRSGAYEIDVTRPVVPIIDREKEKDRLANKMAYNKDIRATPQKLIKKLEKQKVTIPPNRFDELVQEIEERRDWLNEMEALGQGDKYRLIIQQQIQEKVREMEKLKPDKDSNIVYTFNS